MSLCPGKKGLQKSKFRYSKVIDERDMRVSAKERWIAQMLTSIVMTEDLLWGAMTIVSNELAGL